MVEHRADLVGAEALLQQELDREPERLMELPGCRLDTRTGVLHDALPPRKGRREMGIRTVRLDEETEKALAQIVKATGLSVSGAMKKGLLVLRHEVTREAQRVPYDIYKELDLGPGGYAMAPATQARRGVQEAIRRKLRR